MNFKLDGFSIEKYESNESMHKQHYHASTYELYYSIGIKGTEIGKRFCQIGNRECEIESGDILIIPPNTFHRMIGNGGERILCCFSKDFITRSFGEDFFSKIEATKDVFLFRPNENTREYIFDTLSDLFEKNDKDLENEEYFSTRLASLLLLISHEKSGQKEVRYTDERFKKLIQYIDENYSEILGIEEIIKAMSISRGTLFRIFKKHFNISPITYLNSVKIQKACVLLSNKHKNVTEIAFECGFNSCTYFDRIFKQFTGITPAEYKKLLASGQTKKLDLLIM